MACIVYHTDASGRVYTYHLYCTSMRMSIAQQSSLPDIRHTHWNRLSEAPLPYPASIMSGHLPPHELAQSIPSSSGCLVP